MKTADLVRATADLGNSNGKIIAGNKKSIDSSNVQEVAKGTFGSWQINDKYYLIGENARAKFDTNKITENKKALLGRILYPFVEDGATVELITLLPLSLYINQDNKEKYAELLKGEYTVINPSEAEKKFKVESVEICAEGFSSLVTDAKLLQEPLFLVDIGGVDLTGVFVNRTPDANRMFTSERGMNVFYTELGKYLTSKLLETYTNKDTEILYNKYESLADDLKATIDEFATDYIEKYIYQPLRDIDYKPLLHKLILVGGGAIALKRYLEKDDNITVLENAIWSNVEGANLISLRRNKKKC